MEDFIVEYIQDNKQYKVSPSLIDKHTKSCIECEKRRAIMMKLYKIVTFNINEIVARDKLLEQLYDDCCTCFVEEK